ncbi:diguanylate cyclase [Xanthomonas sp. XNM01]|nr:diguanylate cyclase [Xanthomonas sp. XNM01]
MHRGFSVRYRLAVPMALLAFCFHACAMAAPTAPATTSAFRPADPASPDDVLARVKALRESDPAAALALGDPVFDAAADKRTVIELGLELMDAANALRRQDRVLEIGAPLRAQTMDRLTPEQQLRLLKRLNGVIWQPRTASRIAELERDMERLEARLPGEESLAEMWRQLAASYMLMGDSANAERLARLALSKVPTHPHLVEYNANQLIFLVAAQQGRHPEAIEALLEVERVAKALDRPLDAGFLHNATAVFVYAREFDRAIEYGERALASYDQKPRPSLTREAVLNNLASAHEGAEHYERAEALYREALDTALEAGRPTGDILNNLGNVLRRTGRQREALPMLADAARQIEAAGKNEEAAIVHSNIGATQADLGQHPAAAESFARSRALFRLADNVPRRLELYPRMIDNLDALGRHREALELMREFKATSDEVVNVESKTRIAELESAVELARKEGELAELGRERAAQQATLAELAASDQRQRLTVYGLLAAVLVLAVLALLKIRESRVRKRINRELARKNGEIETAHRDLEKLTATIRRQSEEDALTGLRNRRYVQGWLEQLGQTQREALAQGRTPEPVLMLLLDIDHFKRINDQHGHEGGDHALMHFADILRGCSRGSDVVARWGGEEFLWICPDTSMAEAARLFRRICQQLQREPLVRPTGSVPLHVSMGASLLPPWPQHAGDWALSLRVADAALYRAKAEGRGRWSGYIAGPVSVAETCRADAAVDVLEALGCLQRVGGTPSQDAALADTPGA